MSTPELLEVLAINSVAPFLINARLQPLLATAAAEPPRAGGVAGAAFIINVSAMEGKFYRHKTANHPHTNMAKAALNMMTRTAAAELAKAHRIFMSAVDTGWINDENPREVPTAHRGCVPHVLPVAESPSHATPRHPLPFPTIPCRAL